jgi:hypothetical protein
MAQLMARSKLPAVLFALVALLLAAPAFAQFGSIFSDTPPRPPADVPGNDSTLPLPEQQQMPQRVAPADLPRGQADRPSRVDIIRPPATVRGDQPPAQPLPSPMSLPPSSRPGGGTIQTQPLAPPSGAQSAPPAQAPGAPQQIQPPGTARTAPQTLPGSAPGVRQPRGTPGPADTSPQPGDEVVVEPPPQRIANPTAVFSGLDKITGRIISFDVAINETVQFGALQVTPRVCYSRPPTETPNTDAFIEVDEVTLTGEIKRIFSGWMFAASPGLHAIEHPIYDVWITDCKGGRDPTAVAEAPNEPPPSAKKPVRTPPSRPPLRTRTQ